MYYNTANKHTMEILAHNLPLVIMSPSFLDTFGLILLVLFNKKVKKKNLCDYSFISSQLSGTSSPVWFIFPVGLKKKTFWANSIWIPIITTNTNVLTLYSQTYLWCYALRLLITVLMLSDHLLSKMHQWAFPAWPGDSHPCCWDFGSYTSVIHNTLLFSCHILCPYFFFIWATHHELSC